MPVLRERARSWSSTGLRGGSTAPSAAVRRRPQRLRPFRRRPEVLETEADRARLRQHVKELQASLQRAQRAEQEAVRRAAAAEDSAARAWRVALDAQGPRRPER